MESQTIVGLDIGTTKIGVVIAEIGDDGEVKVLGMGTHPSDGLRKGVVVNIDKTVNSINKAIEEAEIMSGIDVNGVYVGIAGRHIRSIDSKGMIAISSRPNNEITMQDVASVIQQAKTINIPSDREIIHVIPKDFVVDDQTGIKDPVGMSGVKLESHVHIVTAGTTSEQNIYRSVEKAGLSVDAIVLEPLASSYSVLDDDERELGVAVVDMGGGTTDVAIFLEDSIRFTASIDFGGTNVTNDLAIGIRTPVDKAEEIKRRSGTCRLDVWGDEMVPVPGVGGREDKEAPKNFIGKIINSRMREILTMVEREIRKTRLADKLGAGIVLTGGGALLDGVQELAEEVFNMPVRIGKPKSLGGITEAISNPCHATGVGLILYGAEQQKQEQFQKKSKSSGEGFGDSVKNIFKVLKNYI
jgi:cell division protein FtsA